MKKILVLHGPNLNLLGRREPEIYGDRTLEELNASIAEAAEKLGVSCRFLQSNIEGELVTALQEADCDGILLNAAAYSHTSIALRDAIAAIQAPVVEVHLTNTAAREDFRRASMIAPVCKGTIAGFGFNSYILALLALMQENGHE